MAQSLQVIPGSFTSGVFRHFSTFRQTQRFPDHILVEIILANGKSFICRGLSVAHLLEVPNCVMIHRTPPHSKDAIVVREEHIISAEFVVKPPGGESGQRPFGFAAGAGAGA